MSQRPGLPSVCSSLGPDDHSHTDSSQGLGVHSKTDSSQGQGVYTHALDTHHTDSSQGLGVHSHTDSSQGLGVYTHALETHHTDSSQGLGVYTYALTTQIQYGTSPMFPQSRLVFSLKNCFHYFGKYKLLSSTLRCPITCFPPYPSYGSLLP